MSSSMSTGGGMEDNGTAFTHLLWLVSRGQALVAELLRLTANVPPVFNPELEPKYADILIDFRYFKVQTTENPNSKPQLPRAAASGMRGHTTLGSSSPASLHCRCTAL